MSQESDGSPAPPQPSNRSVRRGAPIQVFTASLSLSLQAAQILLNHVISVCVRVCVRVGVCVCVCAEAVHIEFEMRLTFEYICLYRYLKALKTPWH